MKLGTLLNTSFVLSFILIVAGAWLKITHTGGSDTLLTAGFILSMVFIAVCVYEISSSPAIDRAEKIMWVFAILFLNPLSGLVYILSGRRRIGSNA